MIFPMRLLRDQRFTLASPEAQIVYAQIYREPSIRPAEGGDVLGGVVAACVALGADPRARADRALTELRARKLLTEVDGALVPAHATAPRAARGNRADLPELRADQLGPRGGKPGWFRTAASRANASKAKASPAQGTLPMEGASTTPPAAPAHAPAVPVTRPVTQPVSVTVTEPSRAVTCDSSAFAPASDLPLPPEASSEASESGREGTSDASEGEGRNGSCDGSGNGSCDGSGNRSEAPARSAHLRTAEELRRLSKRAVGQIFLAILETWGGGHFVTRASSTEREGLGHVIVEAEASEEDLRLIAAQWRNEPAQARESLSWDRTVRAGGKVKTSLLLGKWRGGAYLGKGFGDVLDAARVYRDRLVAKGVKLNFPARPSQSELGLPQNETARGAGPPGARSDAPGVMGARVVTVNAKAAGDTS